MKTVEINVGLFYLFRRLLKRFDEVIFNVRLLWGSDSIIARGEVNELLFGTSPVRIGSFSLSALDERELTVEVLDWWLERIVGRQMRKLELFGCVVVVNDDGCWEKLCWSLVECTCEEVDNRGERDRAERDLNIILWKRYENNTTVLIHLTYFRYRFGNLFV